MKLLPSYGPASEPIFLEQGAAAVDPADAVVTHVLVLRVDVPFAHPEIELGGFGLVAGPGGRGVLRYGGSEPGHGQDRQDQGGRRLIVHGTRPPVGKSCVRSARRVRELIQEMPYLLGPNPVQTGKLVAGQQIVDRRLHHASPVQGR